MDTFQIDSLLKNNLITKPFYGGTMCADDIYEKYKKFSSSYPFFQVVNTDLCGQPGQHWVVLFYTGENVNFFDSLSQSPYKYEHIFGELKKLNKSVIYNAPNICLQEKNSNTCGLHCLFFAYIKCKYGYSLNKFLEKYYTNNSSFNDCMVVSMVEKFFKK